MLTPFQNQYDLTKYINYMLIGYAFSLPISKAGISFFEVFMLILWLLEGAWKDKFKVLKNDLLSMSIVLLIAVSLIASLWSVNIPYALDYVGKYRHFLVILIIYTSFDKKYIQHVFSAFLIGMLISEIFSYGIFFEIFTYKDVSPSDPSPFMDHTNYSAYLAFTSIILLTRFFNSLELTSKIIYALFFITVTGNLFINGGRTGQVIFVVLLIITFILSLKSKLKAIVYSVIILGCIFLSAYSLSQNFNERTNQAITDAQQMIYDNNYRGSFSTRVALWLVGFDKFSENILLGSGIGNEMNDIKKYATQRGFEEHLIGYADHHNSFVTFAVQLGIVGVFLCIMIFYSLVKLRFSSYEFKVLNITFYTTFFLLSMIGISFHLMNSMVFFALFAGLLNKISFFEKGKEGLEV